MQTLLKEKENFDLYVKREYSFFQVHSFIPCFVNLIKSLLEVKTTARFESKNGWISLYVLREHMDIFIQHYVRLIEKGNSFLEDEIKVLDRTGNAWVAGAEKIAQASRKNEVDLQGLLQEFWDLMDTHAFSLWKTFVIPEAGNIVFAKLLDKYVPQKLHPEATVTHSRPSKKAHLLRLSEALSEKDDLDERVAYVREHYPWIFTTDLFSPLPTNEQYLEYAKTFKAPHHQELSSKEYFSKEVMPVISLCRDISYVKDHRDEFRRKAFFYIQPLVERIIDKFKVGREDLWYILPHELCRLGSERKKVIQEISERKIGYVFETNGKDSISFQGLEVLENFVKEEQILDNDEIKGVVGSPGKVRGRVRIIQNSSNLSNFKENDVLVAITTNPDYISAMQKASAFVTDEGGITCHAAIVSRELKKPCIIGTKIATKVLKDGDMVEVDADSGIVRIVSRK